MLVCVRDAGEAAQAAACGADLVEADLTQAASVRAVHPGPLRVVGDAGQRMPALLASATAVHAEEVCLALDPTTAMPARDALPLIVARMSAGPDAAAAIAHLRGRAQAVMIDAGPARRLLDRAGIEQLDEIAGACRANELAFGFGGGLEAPDVARLLLLEPDVLGFDIAVRVGHDPNGALDPRALDAIRSLIPRAEGPAAGTTAQLEPSVVDRIFVRDFVIPLSIGAYKSEHGARQRVRFGVDVEVRRDPAPPRDMRDVFSYDVIIETIRVFAARPHVVFVEALAEEVAAALLDHAPVQSATVTVEKLDVIDGVVGIQIHRRRG